MEKSVFAKQRFDIQEEIKHLKNKLKTLEETQCAEEGKLPPHTKVRIKSDGRIGFVVSYYIGWCDDVCVKLNKQKKDGTEANQSMGCYNLKVDEIEPVL